MSRLTAKLIFAFSAACFVVPSTLIMVYELIVPMPYNPGTYAANDTMQMLLNAGDFSGNLGMLLFFVGLFFWYREAR